MNCVALTPISRVSRSSKPRPKPVRTLPVATLSALSPVHKKNKSSLALNFSFLTVASKDKQIRPVAAPCAQPATHHLFMSITIDANLVSQLKTLVIRACGDLASFIRMQPVARTNKIKMSFSLSTPAVDMIMHTVMCSLPSAEFGCITTA